MAVSITLWEAYLIETPLAKGMSSSTLLGHVKQGNSQAINSFDNTFDYSDLIEAYQKDPEKIEEAIHSGYTIKFVSINGIKRLLHLKFNLEEGKDYAMEDEKLTNILLDEKQFKVFKKILSPNWHVDRTQMEQGYYNVNVAHLTTVK